MASFDIVCQVDFQEVTNAVDQARREIANRDEKLLTVMISKVRTAPSSSTIRKENYSSRLMMNTKCKR